MSDCTHLIPFQILIIIGTSQQAILMRQCPYIIFVFIMMSGVECRNR